MLYLGPTNQLVDQTIEKARQVRLPVVTYERGAPIATEFLNGDAIMVANYHTLVNGRSTFGVPDGRGAPVSLRGLICDDARAAFGTIRDQFSLNIARVEHRELYSDLIARLRPAIEEIGWAGRLEEVLSGREDFVVEIPYWAWREQHAAIEVKLVRNHANDFGLVLPLLRGSFHACHYSSRNES